MCRCKSNDGRMIGIAISRLQPTERQCSHWPALLSQTPANFISHFPAHYKQVANICPKATWMSIQFLKAVDQLQLCNLGIGHLDTNHDQSATHEFFEVAHLLQLLPRHHLLPLSSCSHPIVRWSSFLHPLVVAFDETQMFQYHSGDPWSMIFRTFKRISLLSECEWINLTMIKMNVACPPVAGYWKWGIIVLPKPSSACVSVAIFFRFFIFHSHTLSNIFIQCLGICWSESTRQVNKFRCKTSLWLQWGQGENITSKSENVVNC